MNEDYETLKIECGDCQIKIKQTKTDIRNIDKELFEL